MIIDHPAPGSEPHLRRLWQNTFGDSEAFLDDFFRTAYSSARCLCVWKKEKIVAAVYWFGCICEKKPVAYVYALAVDAGYRDQGIGTKLMEKAHAVLEAQGYTGVLLVPQEERLWELYARLGYVQGPDILEWACHAANQNTSVKPLDAPSYAAARRRYLPEGGVVQEGENLRFLQTQAQFWAGEDCILAARWEENRLICLEILGNLQAAPGILSTLRCSEGIFRTFTPHMHGTQSLEEPACRPFAMYRPLGPTPVPMPTYFAFAFD